VQSANAVETPPELEEVDPDEVDPDDVDPDELDPKEDWPPQAVSTAVITAHKSAAPGGFDIEFRT
jgi:hypothetical protein